MSEQGKVEFSLVWLNPGGTPRGRASPGPYIIEYSEFLVNPGKNSGRNIDFTLSGPEGTH